MSRSDVGFRMGADREFVILYNFVTEVRKNLGQHIQQFYNWNPKLIINA